MWLHVTGADALATFFFRAFPAWRACITPYFVFVSGFNVRLRATMRILDFRGIGFLQQASTGRQRFLNVFLVGRLVTRAGHYFLPFDLEASVANWARKDAEGRGMLLPGRARKQRVCRPLLVTITSSGKCARPRQHAVGRAREFAS